MYRYGLTYYQAGTEERIPVTGLDVRFVRPGGTWESGLRASELSPGDYEVYIPNEAAAGYYHIWDTSSFNPGRFSGKTAIIGPLGLDYGFQQGQSLYAMIASLQAQIDQLYKVFGCDIYIQDSMPVATPNSNFVWIDTDAIELIGR